jgi:hypothetical protein
MQYNQRYSLILYKGGEFRQWLANNATLLAKNAPEGWTYLGTWFTVRGFGKHDCETRWELTDYNALGADFGTEAFQKAMLEWFDFVELSIPGDTALMKSATDVDILKGT